MNKKQRTIILLIVVLVIILILSAFLLTSNIFSKKANIIEQTTKTTSKSTLKQLSPSVIKENKKETICETIENFPYKNYDKIYMNKEDCDKYSESCNYRVAQEEKKEYFIKEYKTCGPKIIREKEILFVEDGFDDRFDNKCKFYRCYDYNNQYWYWRGWVY